MNRGDLVLIHTSDYIPNFYTVPYRRAGEDEEILYECRHAWKYGERCKLFHYSCSTEPVVLLAMREVQYGVIAKLLHPEHGINIVLLLPGQVVPYQEPL